MNNKMAISISLSTITLRASGLNAQIKRHMDAEWVTRQEITYVVYNSLTSD